MADKVYDDAASLKRFNLEHPNKIMKDVSANKPKKAKWFSFRNIMVMIALILAFFYERVYQRFRIQLRAPPTYQPEYNSTGMNQFLQLNKEQLEFYDTNGYVIIKNGVNKEGVDFLRDVAESFTFSVPGPYSGFINNPWRMQPGLLDFLHYSPAAGIVAQLLRAPSVRLVLDYLITMKPDGAKGSPFHADMMHITDDSPEISLWISLSEISVEGGGGVAVLPGSHKWRNSEDENLRKCFWRVDKTTEVMTTLSAEEIATCKAHFEEIKISVALGRGDIIAWDRWLMHGTQPFLEANKELKTTEVPRMAYNIRLAGSGSIFQMPDFLCSGRPRWEWYQDWDTAVSGEEMTGAFMPQLYPNHIEREREVARDESINNPSMSRWSFTKMLFEFGVYKPVMCKLPQALGLMPFEHDMHEIPVYN